MGFRIEAPKQDGNARFETLKVNLNENNSATRVVVVDNDGKFYYGTGGSGGASGSSGTSGANGSNGTSGTSGTGFNTINSPLQGRLLVSDGTPNAATASANLFYDTGSLTLQVTGSIESSNLIINADVFEFTGSVKVSGSITGSLYGTSSWAVSASWAPEAEQASTASYVTASSVYGPYGSNSIISASYAATASSADSFYIRADRFEFTGSIEVDGGITGSLYGTSSWAVSASWAPGVESASYAATASSADSFYIRADRFEFTGSIEVSGSITGSLYGTSSWAVSASWAPEAEQAATASYITASNVYGPFGSNSIISASYAATASSADSFYIRADRFEFTGSVEVNGGITGSLLGTASFAETASYALNVPATASWAIRAVTASSADDFLVRGTLTAQTIVAQTITSSTEYVTGSTIFGSQLSDTHQFTGSVNITGSLTANDLTILADVFEFTGSIKVDGDITGSLYGTSSWAVSASWAPNSTQAATASYVTASNVYGPFGSNSIISASYAATASSADSFIIRSDVFEFTGSVRVSGSITGSLLGTASFATSTSYAPNIYNSDGTLISNRTVSIGSNTLYFSSSRASGTAVEIVLNQTQPNSTETNDIALVADYNITANSATNQLVVRPFTLKARNTLTGGGAVQNLRAFNLASYFNSSTTTTNADLIYLENATGAGTVTNYRGIRIANFYGTNRAGIAMAPIGGTNSSYVLIGTDVIPSGFWGIYQSESTYNNYFNGKVVIGTNTINPSYSLDVNGTSRTTTLHVQNLKNPAIGVNGQIDVFVVNNPGDAGYQKLSILAGGSPYSTVLRTSGDGGGSRGMILDASGAGGEIYFGTSNANRWLIAGSYNVSGSGHIFPIGDNLYDIGNRTARVANYYGVRSYISNLLVVTGSANITGSVTSSGDVVPGITDTYNLGSSTFKWKDLYLSGSTIYLGNTEIKEINNKVTALYGFSGSFTGSLLGTSSFATNSATASSADDFYIRADRFEFTGSVIVDGGITGSLLGTASFAETASYALNVLSTASWAYNALTASSADDFYVRADLFEFTGSLKVSGSITGSLFGTSSWAIRAITASYIDPANIPGISGFKLTTGSIDAEVNVIPQNLFLISSGSTEYLNISSSGNTDIYSNLFIVRNFTTGQPVLKVSQSIVQIATQSFDPTGTTDAGSIWFTPYTMYIGLEDNIIPN